MNMGEQRVAQRIVRMGDESRAEREIDSRVRQLRQREPKLSKEQAMTKVLQREPALYDRLVGSTFAEKPGPPTAPPIGSSRLETWSDVEQKARELFRDANFPSFERALAWLINNDRDAGRIAALMSEGLI
jgi:hypothetical protein